jgi:hypothetical protein
LEFCVFIILYYVSEANKSIVFIDDDHDHDNNNQMNKNKNNNNNSKNDKDNNNKITDKNKNNNNTYKNKNRNNNNTDKTKNNNNNNDNDKNIKETIKTIKQKEVDRLKVRKQIELLNTVGTNLGKGKGRGKGTNTVGRGQGKSEGMSCESVRGRGGRGGRGRGAVTSQTPITPHHTTPRITTQTPITPHHTTPHITSIVHKDTNKTIFTDEITSTLMTKQTDQQRQTDGPTETSKRTYDTDEHIQLCSPTSSQSSQRSKLSLKFNKANKTKPTLLPSPKRTSSPASTPASTLTQNPCTRINTHPTLPYNKRKIHDTTNTPNKKLKTQTQENLINSQSLSCIDNIIKTVNSNFSPNKEVQNAVFNLQLEMERMAKM